MAQIAFTRDITRRIFLSSIQRNPISRWLATNTCAQGQSTSKASADQQPETQPNAKDKPIKFFNSHASQWKAEHTRSGKAPEDVPWYQPYVVLASVTIFMIYFCVLREENDIDQGLERSLFEHVPGLEEKQLLITYRYNLDNGLSTLDIEKRMKELGMEY
ncbi:uncharacterized protein LOC129753183 [Uranotaenia lowii]|uniref:uncharacterized protein LOC129753183 n=1 Tax=Uranotaenia lowii TaxID=190385 RepID=UPI00247978AC|nr:uncharacterized protein LOC129753183 [Uranotaenia lowii]